jgi:Na+-transporting NADH:ubiquinone oxidoreductase subunit NqrF
MALALSARRPRRFGVALSQNADAANWGKWTNFVMNLVFLA